MLPEPHVAGDLIAGKSKLLRIHRDLVPDDVIILSHENGRLLPRIVDLGINARLDIERHLTLAGEGQACNGGFGE